MNAATGHAGIRTACALARSQGRRHLDVARELGITEQQLVAAHADAATHAPMQAIALRPEWHALLDAVHDWGRVMHLTRNEACVHEVTEALDPVPAGPAAAGSVMTEAAAADAASADAAQDRVLLQGARSSLLLRLSTWHRAYLVTEQVGPRMLRSLQVFDAHGTAVHKIYLRETAREPAFHRTGVALAALPAGDGDPGDAGHVADAGTTAAAAARTDAPGCAELERAWRSLRSAFELDALLAGFGSDLGAALHHAPADFAHPLADTTAVHRLLETVAFDGLDVAIEVDNGSTRQSHAGPIRNVAVRGPWLNVLDPEFNLHLREDLVRSVWLLRGPTRHGLCHRMVLLDASGRPIVSIGPSERAGRAEPCGWSARMDELGRECAACEH